MKTAEGKTIVHTDKAPEAIGPYSQAVRTGNMVYTAGQIGLDPATMEIVSGGVEAETRQVLNNLNEGQGSMGKLLNDDSLYYYLTQTAADLDSLFIDLRENPDRYVQFSVFGKKDKTEKKKKKQE